MNYRKIQRKRIKIADSAKRNIRDQFGSNSSIFAPKRNRVIVESRDVRTGERKVEEDTTNLIVYHGRSWIMQRAFNLNLGAEGVVPWDSNDSTSVEIIQRENWRNMYINWFAVGGGGAASENPLEPETVESVEHFIQEPYPIQPDLSATGHLRYTHPAYSEGDDLYRYDDSTSASVLDYHKFDDNYPQFLPDQDIVPNGGTSDPNYEEMEVKNSPFLDFNSVRPDSYLKALIRVTIAPEEYNGPKYYDPGSPGETYRYLNEAGLFVSPSHDAGDFAGYDYNAVEMFAKVNFSSIRKDDTRELVFSWYVYF